MHKLTKEGVGPGGDKSAPGPCIPSKGLFLRYAALAIAVVFFCATAFAQSASWTRSESVEVIAPDHRPDGKTWDPEVPILLGPVMPNAGNPAPDMMLCTVDALGHENCIHKAEVNKWGVPYSVCPDVYKCTFSNVKLPTSGSFGILIVDLDFYPAAQDYMLGAIVHIGDAEKTDNFKIEKALKAIIAKWHVVGAPDEFVENKLESCTSADPCFGSSKGGVPSVSFSSMVVGSCAGIGMAIKGTLSFEAGEAANEVDFRYRSTENECPGTTEYVWEFGDSLTVTNSQTIIRHRYASAGAYTAKVIPRCKRSMSVCEATPSTTALSVGR